jgi:hypothetical protein
MDNISLIDKVDLNQIQGQLAAITNFQRIVKSQFTQNVDYGIIPRTRNKPTLLKPGAEKICMLLGLKSEFEIAEQTRDWENGFFQYMIKCKLIKTVDGVDEVITEGLGSANTLETKYVTADAFSVDNTVLKMAKKRALVDAALMVGSLSNIFTQDIEDMDLTGGSTNQRRYYTDRDGTITQAQARRMFELAEGNDEAVRQAMEKFGYRKSADIKKTDYDKICSMVNEIITKPAEPSKEEPKDVEEPKEEPKAKPKAKDKTEEKTNAEEKKDDTLSGILTDEDKEKALAEMEAAFKYVK